MATKSELACRQRLRVMPESCVIAECCGLGGPRSQGCFGLHPHGLQALHAHGLGGAELLGEDLHSVFFHHPAEGFVLGFGDVGMPAVEVGDEVVFIDVFGGAGDAAFVANLDGF